MCAMSRLGGTPLRVVPLGKLGRIGVPPRLRISRSRQPGTSTRVSPLLAPYYSYCFYGDSTQMRCTLSTYEGKFFRLQPRGRPGRQQVSDGPHQDRIGAAPSAAPITSLTCLSTADRRISSRQSGLLPVYAANSVRVNCAFAFFGVGVVLSVTVTVNGYCPGPGAVLVALTVPLMTPVVAFRTRPRGRCPEVIFHVYGDFPPVATSAALVYGLPIVAVDGLSAVLTTWNLPTTVRVKLWVASARIPLWAVRVIGKVPVTVGLPVRALPVKVTPAGSAPDSVMVGTGEPEAVGVNVLVVPLMNRVEAAEVNAAGELPLGPGTAVQVKPFGSPALALKVTSVFQLSARAPDELAQASPASHGCR